MDSPHFFDADSSKRVTRMVQAVERNRGDATGDYTRRVGFPQVLPMVCISQPNIEAIEAGGVWPETIAATPLSERFGYTLEDLGGECLPPYSPGGCASLVPPCGPDIGLTVVLSNGQEYTLEYAGSQPGPVYETWNYTGNGVVAWINGGPPNFSGQCFPVRLAPLCTTFYMRSDGTEIPADDYCNSASFPPGQAPESPEVCRASFPIVSMKSSTGPFGCGNYFGRVSWNTSGNGSGGTGEIVEPDTPIDDAQDEVLERCGLYRVKTGIFGQGVPLRGQVFCAYFYGGSLYHLGFRNACLVGPGTGEDSPYTIATENCGNRVPWSWPHVDYGDKEGARLVIGWNHVSRRYEPVGVTC